MQIAEYTLLLLMFCLGVIAAVSDIRTGIISNKIIAWFALCGVVTDTIYYGMLAPDTIEIFFLNVVSTTVISFCLYYTHAIAGGDCKLIPVLSLLYPAGMYLEYGGSSITLFIALCFAIFFGYLYMLFAAIWKLVTDESHINKTYIINTVKIFAKSYFRATLFVMFLNLFFAIIDRNFLHVDAWIVWVTCIITAWISGRVRILRNRVLIGLVLAADFGLAIYMKVIPFSLNPRTYLFTVVLLLCQMMIRTNLYEQIQTSRIKKGMILSSVSSILMQNSKIAGLPGISTEDLRNRLTEDEAESVRRWGKSTKGTKEISIVKKIPFAIFLAMGYVCYFIIWRIVA